MGLKKYRESSEKGSQAAGRGGEISTSKRAVKGMGILERY